MAEEPQRPKTIKELIAEYWRHAALIGIVICVIAGVAWWLVYDEFVTATTIINGKLATSVFPAYGQLGDAIGGILNPIFGFFTVCLLIWSIRVQLSELSLTRDEVKKSAKALADQVELSKNEYERKQVEIAAEHYIVTIEDCFDISIPAVSTLPSDKIDPRHPQVFTLRRALADKIDTNPMSRMNHWGLLAETNSAEVCGGKQPYLAVYKGVRFNLIELVACMECLGENYVTSPTLRSYWRNRTLKYLGDIWQLSLISKEERDQYFDRITNSLIADI